MAEAQTANDSYKWVGAPLTRGVCSELILELHTGDVVETQDLTSELPKVHKERGGASPSGKPAGLVKKALAELKANGQAENLAKGIWKILLVPEEYQSDEELEVDEEQSEDEEPQTYPIDKILGEGKWSVYAYYLPAYKELADLRGEERWPIKVGKAEKKVELRVAEQASRTAVPETARIALVIRTDQPAKLESAIHIALTMRGLKVDDAGGDEWFNTNPAEIEDVYSLLAGTAP